MTSTHEEGGLDVSTLSEELLALHTTQPSVPMELPRLEEARGGRTLTADCAAAWRQFLVLHGLSCIIVGQTQHSRPVSVRFPSRATRNEQLFWRGIDMKRRWFCTRGPLHAGDRSRLRQVHTHPARISQRRDPRRRERQSRRFNVESHRPDTAVADEWCAARAARSG